MRDAVVVQAVRTPIGKRNGVLAGVHPVELSAVVLSELVRRTGIDPGDIDDVQWGMRHPARRSIQQHRTLRSSGGRLARDGTRRDDQPGVWF